MIQGTNLNPDGGSAREGASCPTPAQAGQMPTSAGASAAPIGEQETAPSAKEQMREKAGQAVNRITENLEETGRQARRKAAETARQLREQGQSILSHQKERVADEISHFGAAAHDAADRLDEENDHNVACYVHAAADRLDDLANYLRSNSLQRFASDMSRSARRQPELFFGGMFLAGMTLARFFKASSSPRRRESVDWREDEWHDVQDFDTRHPVASETEMAGGIARGTASLTPGRGSVVTDPEPTIPAGPGPVITSEDALRPAERHTIPSVTTVGSGTASSDSVRRETNPSQSGEETRDKDRPQGATCPPNLGSEVL